MLSLGNDSLDLLVSKNFLFECGENVLKSGFGPEQLLPCVVQTCPVIHLYECMIYTGMYSMKYPSVICN